MFDPKFFSVTKVRIGACRLCYVHLFEKWNPNNEENGGKYGVTILIPKNETATINAIKGAIQAAYNIGIASKWQGKTPKKWEDPLKDGDEKEDEAFHDHWYLNAKAINKPGVIDRNKVTIIDENEVYSGMWGVLAVSFFPYSVSGKYGVSCGLDNVMKYKDDDRFGGRASAQNDFEDVSIEEEDDDL